MKRALFGPLGLFGSYYPKVKLIWSLDEMAHSPGVFFFVHVISMNVDEPKTVFYFHEIYFGLFFRHLPDDILPKYEFRKIHGTTFPSNLFAIEFASQGEAIFDAWEAYLKDRERFMKDLYATIPS